MYLPQAFVLLCTLATKGPGSSWRNTEEHSGGSTLGFEETTHSGHTEQQQLPKDSMLWARSLTQFLQELTDGHLF